MINFGSVLDAACERDHTLLVNGITVIELLGGQLPVPLNEKTDMGRNSG